MLNNFDTVIFDMDGVLADTQSIKAEVTVRVMKEMFGKDISMDDFNAVFSGMRFIDAAKALLPDVGAEEMDLFTQKRYQIVNQELKTRARIMPDVEQLLVWLQAKKVKLGVATGAIRMTTDTILQTIGLESTFAVTVSADEVNMAKPAPDAYLKAAQELGSNPASCLVIEDALNGIAAGKAAGIRVIAIAGTFTQEELLKSEADLVCKNHAEILEILQNQSDL